MSRCKWQIYSLASNKFIEQEPAEEETNNMIKLKEILDKEYTYFMEDDYGDKWLWRKKK